MEVLSIIPARGGSKGIPRKNIKSLLGKALIAYTIENALACRDINRVVVSTDDEEIEQVSLQYGAEVVQRPDEMSGDLSSSETSLFHVLDQLKNLEGYIPDLIVFLQCTSPLTTSKDIEGTVKALLDENADSAFTVVPFHHFIWKREPDGNSLGINHNKLGRQMRQEKLPQYLENGAVYVMRTDGFRRTKHRFFGKTAMYIMPPERCLEIDDPYDLELAEFFMRRQKRIDNIETLPEKLKPNDGF